MQLCFSSSRPTTCRLARQPRGQHRIGFPLGRSLGCRTQLLQSVRRSSICSRQVHWKPAAAGDGSANSASVAAPLTTDSHHIKTADEQEQQQAAAEVSAPAATAAASEDDSTYPCSTQQVEQHASDALSGAQQLSNSSNDTQASSGQMSSARTALEESLLQVVALLVQAAAEAGLAGVGKQFLLYNAQGWGVALKLPLNLLARSSPYLPVLVIKAPQMIVSSEWAPEKHILFTI